MRNPETQETIRYCNKLQSMGFAPAAVKTGLTIASKLPQASGMAKAAAKIKQVQAQKEQDEINKLQAKLTAITAEKKTDTKTAGGSAVVPLAILSSLLFIL